MSIYYEQLKEWGHEHQWIKTIPISDIKKVIELIERNGGKETKYLPNVKKILNEKIAKEPERIKYEAFYNKYSYCFELTQKQFLNELNKFDIQTCLNFLEYSPKSFLKKYKDQIEEKYAVLKYWPK